MSESELVAGDHVPRLLHFRVSHYNEKVRWALDYKRWPHRRKALVPGFHLAGVRLRTGQNKTPVLEMSGQRLVGSAHIIEELERLRPDPPLYPEAQHDRKRALSLQSWFDDEVAPTVRRIFWSTYIDDAGACSRMATNGASGPARFAFRALFPLLRPAFRKNIGLDREKLEAARAALDGIFARLESEIGPKGYLIGDRFGLADLVAAAIMSAIVRPPQFSYPLPEPLPEPLVALRESLAGRRGYQWVMETYARHRGPSAEVAAS
jgi:glutathione S-transferase